MDKKTKNILITYSAFLIFIIILVFGTNTCDTKTNVLTLPCNNKEFKCEYHGINQMIECENIAKLYCK